MKKVFIICLVFILVTAFILSVLIMSVNNLLEVEDTHIVSAQKNLHQLRRGTPDYEDQLRLLRYSMIDGELSLSDIGTNEEELEKLRIKGCKKAAEESLNCLQEGTYQYDYWLEHLQKELKAGGLSLADIGTNEKELQELTVMCCKKAAKNYLSILRDGTDDYTGYMFFVNRVRKGLKKFNLSLEDIGTNEEELRFLAPRLDPKKMAQTPCFFNREFYFIM